MPRKKKVEETVEVEVQTEAEVEVSDGDPGVAEQVKDPDIELVDELIRYEFSGSELVDLATDMGELMQRVDRLQAEKKSAASGYDADIKKMDLDMQEMAQFIRDRFQMRREPCYMVKDFTGRKAYYFRADQRELEWLQDALEAERLFGRVNDMADGGPVKTRDLKSWELQRELEFGDSEEGAKPEEE